ncbi:hypothetical protein SO802_032098 [Lithocarpus litseifolius]|uniref:Uncharacterized protein n=1 Tax=Lithocarpus litseifolius TaxID=425828 RepID=A0AAW2BMZ8_9ROSI
MPTSSVSVKSRLRISFAMLSLQNKPQPNLASTSGGHRENWGESMMGEVSPRTDTSTDDTDDKNQRHERGQLAVVAASDSSDKSKEKSGYQKEYVQQLESSHLKLTKQEQERPRACHQVSLPMCSIAIAFDYLFQLSDGHSKALASGQNHLRFGKSSSKIRNTWDNKTSFHPLLLLHLQ